ncbi:hypothetical protein C942_00498 [Photobacterium marinum]|uniref:Prohead serine protease domain-containing protein n=1 Tax=Photobacterium marinum TaxID=1056511 RepID=L8JB69_9GAMM|nr:HK97 family phage prohead protease [Photobacterium marinum]ELR66056.1 hypothetical protein C942_00498 [Photobacterium marinum]
MKNKQFKVDFSIKEINEEGRFSGYANVADYKDHAGDVTRKGAFLNSIKAITESGRKIPMLWQHQRDQVIGVYDVLKEDEHGLYVEGQLVLEVQKACEAHALMKAGAISGLSIGYVVKKETYDSSTNTNYLEEVELKEISVVTFPCNELSRVETVKSLIGDGEVPTERQMEKALKEQFGLSQKQVKAFLARGYIAIGGGTIQKEEFEKEMQEKINQIKNLISAIQSN